MTNLTEAKMAKLEDEGSSGRRIIWIMLAGFGIVMTGGAIAGFIAQHQSDGDPTLSSAAIGILTVFVAIIATLAFTIWRNSQALKSDGEPMTRRERLNRNIMLSCVLLGAAIGAVLAATGSLDISDPATAPFAVFADGPIPKTVALLLVFVWAVAMPIVAWVWHTRAIDEQEASAYRDGGYYAAYAYLILAPAWWLLWRAGFLPEPSGVAIFLTFAIIWSAVWFWKKYR
jgi:hypothetical protein